MFRSTKALYKRIIYIQQTVYHLFQSKQEDIITGPLAPFGKT